MKSARIALRQLLSSFALGRSCLAAGRVANALRIARKEAAVKGITVSRRGEQIVFQKGQQAVAISSRHFVYARDLVIDFEQLYGAVDPEILGECRLVDYSHPRWHRLTGSGKRVYLTAFSEGDSVNALYLRYGKVTAGDVVFDLGANCGVAAMSFAAAVGAEGKVIAAEPDPRNFEALQWNLAEHGISNVQGVQAGIWSTTGRIYFDADGSMGATAIVDPRNAARGEIREIRVFSMMDLAERFKLSRVDVVKMDIEGSEFAVVAGAASFLERFRSRWIIEVHDRRRIYELTRVFNAANYVTELAIQSQLHRYPLLLAWPRGMPRHG